MMTPMQWLDVGRRYLGPMGVAGLVLVLSIPLFWLAAVQPTGAKAESLKREVARVMAQPPMKMRVTEAPDRAEELARFHAQFPHANELSALIEKIHALALKSGVTLRLGEYKLERSGTDKLWRYEILLPVEAGYPELKLFIDTVSSEIATLGLKEVSFKREAVGDKAVKIQLRFVLFGVGNA
jgi:Tfp pilus assembly protein PilO